jgi:hypothetical protein
LEGTASWRLDPRQFDSGARLACYSPRIDFRIDNQAIRM